MTFANRVEHASDVTVRQRIQNVQPRLRVVWAFHFFTTILVLLSGIYTKQGITQKYVPVTDSLDCDKAFVNVLASSIEDPEAFVCCAAGEVTLHQLCAPKSHYLIFAGRLTKFPDAIVLPLFPFAVRWIVTSIRSRSISVGSVSLKRLGFYLLVMIVRTFLLYIGANEIEELFVSPRAADCWYGNKLESHQPQCHGSQFDFSDHVVLFFGSIIPIALMEVLHCLTLPFWYDGWKKETSSIMKHYGWRRAVVPMILVVCLMYLYMIVLMSAHKTTAYFHTVPEIAVGYIISLVVQLPFAYLQCFPKWSETRQSLFGFPPAHVSCD